MKTRCSTLAAASCRGPAFSLMELLLAMGIMTILVGALYGMFHHTQKALRANVSQVDVLESGRAAMDFLARDFEQLAASNVRRETNLLIAMSPLSWLTTDSSVREQMYYASADPPKDFGGYTSVVQNLMVTGLARTNILGEAYFLNRAGEKFIGTSYRIINATNGIGTLARHSEELPARFMGNGWLSASVLTTPAEKYAAIVDRVIHFQVRAYDALGLAMEWDTARRFTNRIYHPNVMLGTNVVLRQDGRPSETACLFLTNALPSYLELELGLLEPKAYDQFKAFTPGSAMAHSFLANRAAQVHLFRQRIPIRQARPLQAALP